MKMKKLKVLLIGVGGREHALAWLILRSFWCSKLFVAPGNFGTGLLAENVPIKATDGFGLLEFALKKGVDLTIVGPEDPLAMGIVDLFQKNGLRIWGPNQRAAKFESSKAFSQLFMERRGIPTPEAGIFYRHEAVQAREFAASLDGRCAVKADGLALGKGALICKSIAEANEAIDGMLSGRACGDAGKTVVIQKLLDGMEISLHAFCDGKTYRLFPDAQDHKRALNGDLGPNTGGMGAYSPTPFLSEAELAEVGRSIFDPWLRGCAEEGIDYRGILYPGVMLTEQGPKVLEFNGRWGDPESEVYVRRLKADLLEIAMASVEGRLNEIEIEWDPVHAACVVMATEGYPSPDCNRNYGRVITGIDEANEQPGVVVFHAGTKLVDGKLVTSGGRVVEVTAIGADRKEALDRAYAGVKCIHFDGMQYRRDIGEKALKILDV